MCPPPEASKQRDVYITYKQKAVSPLNIGAGYQTWNSRFGNRILICFALNFCEDIGCLIIITLLQQSRSIFLSPTDLKVLSQQWLGDFGIISLVSYFLRRMSEYVVGGAPTGPWPEQLKECL